ncbi:MAG: TonB-dependent receptor [Bacteroidales bacterium]|jgi:outer membrane receptor protein involved in Fe transport
MFIKKIASITVSVLFVLGFQLMAQQNVKTINGVVIDQNSRSPIQFANVSVKNTGSGTIADQQGRFSIGVKTDAKTVLVISHISYHKQEITITDSLTNDSIYVRMQPKEVELSDVVVSAGLYQQQLNKIARSAKIISNRQIIDNMSSNVADLLSKIPGFTRVWEYHSPVILRGLNSNRLLIMKDGNRRIGTFPGGYFGQDMNIYDNRKIEIIKGPGSVIYGSGAISGIVNIITGEPFGEKKNSINTSTGYGSNNNEFLKLIKLCHKREKFGISINGKYRKTGNITYGNGEIAENSNVEDRDISINTGYKISEAHKIIVNANYHYGDWGKPRGFNGPTKRFTKIRNKEENFHADLSYSYVRNGIFESLNVNFFYDEGWRDYYQYKYSIVTDKLSTLDLVHYKDKYGGTRIFSIINISDNNKLTTGFDAYIFRLDNPSELFDYYNETQGSTEGYKNAGQQNLGYFISNEWQVSNKIKLLSGIRYDFAEVLEGNTDNEVGKNEQRNAISGNLGVVYSPNTHTNISLNIGRAFRMPTTEELFTRVISCKGIKVGNPKLKPEYSHSIDLGMRGKTPNDRFKYDLALFYNKLDDFINEAPAEQIDADFTLKNTNAIITGAEFSGTYRFSNVFRPYNSMYIGIGAAYVYGIDLYQGNKAPLFGIPPFNISTEMDYRGLLNKKWITGYSIKLSSEYAAPQNRIAEIPEGTEGGPWGYVPSEKHYVFNCSVGINSNSLPGHPKLRVIVTNIFDTDYKPFGSYIPAMGRNIKLVLSLGI